MLMKSHISHEKRRNKKKIRSPPLCKHCLDYHGDVTKRAGWLLILWTQPANVRPFKSHNTVGIVAACIIFIRTYQNI